MFNKSIIFVLNSTKILFPILFISIALLYNPMPTVARTRSSLRADPVVEIWSTIATPRKSRLRSDSDASIGFPIRKSPRLCIQDSPKSPPTVSVIEKCVKFLSLRLEKRFSENFMEKPTWDPKDMEQLRAGKEALHVSTAPKTFVCREDEQNRILDFCKKSIKEDKAGSLYMCGCPGRGKSLSMEIKEFIVSWANEATCSHNISRLLQGSDHRDSPKKTEGTSLYCFLASSSGTLC